MSCLICTLCVHIVEDEQKEEEEEEEERNWCKMKEIKDVHFLMTLKDGWSNVKRNLAINHPTVAPTSLHWDIMAI